MCISLQSAAAATATSYAIEYIRYTYAIAQQKKKQIVCDIRAVGRSRLIQYFTYATWTMAAVASALYIFHYPHDQFSYFCIILFIWRWLVGNHNTVKKIYMHIFKSNDKFAVDLNLCIKLHQPKRSHIVHIV